MASWPEGGGKRGQLPLTLNFKLPEICFKKSCYCQAIFVQKMQNLGLKTLLSENMKAKWTFILSTHSK